jgi:hypothetical protein
MYALKTGIKVPHACMINFLQFIFKFIKIMKMQMYCLLTLSALFKLFLGLLGAGCEQVYKTRNLRGINIEWLY